MTRFVPLTTTDGLVAAVDAHRVHEIVQCDGFVRVYRTDTESFVDVPGTVAELCAMLSDPPAGAVRFVQFDDRAINPARVAWVYAMTSDQTTVWFSGNDVTDYVAVNLPLADVIAKLEGRAS